MEILPKSLGTECRRRTTLEGVSRWWYGKRLPSGTGGVSWGNVSSPTRTLSATGRKPTLGVCPSVVHRRTERGLSEMLAVVSRLEFPPTPRGLRYHDPPAPRSSLPLQDGTTREPPTVVTDPRTIHESFTDDST